MKVFAAVVLCLAFTMSALAQQRPFPSPADRDREMSDRLRALIEQAERTRSAERWFLDALRSLVHQYGGPQYGGPQHGGPKGQLIGPRRNAIFHEDFRSVDMKRSPRWQVGAGRFHIHRSLGLYTAVAPQGESTLAEEDLNLTDILLKSLLEGRQRKQEGERGIPSSGHAELFARRPFPNTFTLRMEFLSRYRPGRFEIAFFSGSRRAEGYRVVYYPGVNQGLELISVSRYGATVIAALNAPLLLEDRGFHALEWLRTARGEMRVLVDGQELLRAIDRTERGNFDGFALVNRGGEFAIRELAIWGE